MNKCFGQQESGITSLKVSEKCPHFKIKYVFDIDTLISSDICLLLVHAGLSYYFTKLNGVYFSFTLKYP